MFSVIHDIFCRKKNRLTERNVLIKQRSFAEINISQFMADFMTIPYFNAGGIFARAFRKLNLIGVNISDKRYPVYKRICLEPPDFPL